MAKQEVRFTVDFTIYAEKLEEFKTIAQAMITATGKEQGTLGYDWFFSSDSTHCRLIETYVDANAVLAHLNGPAVQELVPKLLGTASLGDFEVYGDPGPEASNILAGLGAKTFQFQLGMD
jgi:quinol monooxygenase YgiN